MKQKQLLSVAAANRTIQRSKPRGLAGQIRAREAELAQVLDYLFDLAVGRVEGSNRDRLAAVEIIHNRGFGKPLESHVVATLSEAQEGAAELSREELLRLVALPLAPALPQGPQSGPEAVQPLDSQAEDPDS